MQEEANTLKGMWKPQVLSGDWELAWIDLNSGIAYLGDGNHYAVNVEQGHDLVTLYFRLGGNRELGWVFQGKFEDNNTLVGRGGKPGSNMEQITLIRETVEAPPTSSQ